MEVYLLRKDQDMLKKIMTIVIMNLIGLKLFDNFCINSIYYTYYVFVK